MLRKLSCATCELKTTYPLSSERNRIDRWIERETMEEIDTGRGEKGGGGVMHDPQFLKAL